MGRAEEQATLTQTEWMEFCSAIGNALVRAGLPMSAAVIRLPPKMWAQARLMSQRAYSCWPYVPADRFMFYGITFGMATDDGAL